MILRDPYNRACLVFNTLFRKSKIIWSKEKFEKSEMKISI